MKVIEQLAQAVNGITVIGAVTVADEQLHADELEWSALAKLSLTSIEEQSSSSADRELPIC